MADPSIGGGRDVWASTAMLEATRAERARHAAACRDAAGAIAAAAAKRGLTPMAPLGRVAALRAALTRLGLDDGELASEETLAAALGDWALQHADRNVADDGPHIGAGDADDQDLLAAAAIFDVRVVVVSAACETPLVYDLGNEDDEAVVVLGHGGAAAYCELAPKHVPKSHARRLHAAAYAALVAQQHAPAAALRCVLCGAVRPRAGPPSTKPPPLEAEEAPADPDAALAKLRAAIDARSADVISCEAALRESENDAFAATFGGSGGDPALASAAAVARRYALRASRAELEAAKATAAVTELRRDLAEALAREATLRAAHAYAASSTPGNPRDVGLSQKRECSYTL